MENYNIVPFNNIKKVLPILNKISLLGGLSQSEISQVFSLSEWKSFNKNEIIFKIIDDYFFESSRTAAFKQIGNAVPVLMGEGIAKKIREMI